MTIKILFIGDIVGKAGRQATAKVLPELKNKCQPDLIIANGENATHGNAIALKGYNELKAAGVDFFTLGDHSFESKENRALLAENKPDLIRPANYPPDLPGSGFQLLELGTKKILLINLIGRVFMKFNYDCPFRKLTEILQSHQAEKLAAIIVDFHGEATSEKNAFARHFDGQLSAIFGTHTHVPTCDQKILPQGTAYVTDVGMVGAVNSVIGVKKEPVIKMFLQQFKNKFEPEDAGTIIFNAVLVEINPKTAKARSIKRLDKEVKI